jgi:cytochrome c553
MLRSLMTSTALARLGLALSVCAWVSYATPVYAQPGLTARPIAPLKTVKVPLPSNLDEFVKDRAAAVALGKALFWDMQAGSDGLTACATCHWHAGADARLQNTLGLPKDNPHDISLRDAISKLSEGDFPFVRIDDPNSNDDAVSPNAVVVENREEIVGSKGVELRDFVKIIPGQSVELGNLVPDPKFNTHGVNLRTVTSRNSPTVINAVFNHRNNWDGSASYYFNGVNNAGKFDPDARVTKATFSYDNWYLAFLDKVLPDSEICADAKSPGRDHDGQCIAGIAGHESSAQDRNGLDRA